MKRFVLTSIFCFGMTSTALAAPPTPREKAGDRRALHQDSRAVAADRWDAARMQALLDAYRVAKAGGNAAQLADLDRCFMAELALELRDSRGEVREEQREVRHDVLAGKPVKAVRDAQDLADDRRDRADDQRDRGLEVAALAKKRLIRDRYQALLGRFDGGANATKLGLLDEALALARSEVRGDVQEQREDQHERREDRRDGRRPD